MRFVDTSVLLYGISTDPAEASKADAARRVLAMRDLGLSSQVLQELYVQTTRDTRPDPISHEQAVRLVRSYRRFPVLGITPDLVMAAIGAHHRFGISYGDAAILEAARALGCEVVLSEDLNEGHDYAGVRVENPLR